MSVAAAVEQNQHAQHFEVNRQSPEIKIGLAGEQHNDQQRHEKDPQGRQAVRQIHEVPGKTLGSWAASIPKVVSL